MCDYIIECHTAATVQSMGRKIAIDVTLHHGNGYNTYTHISKEDKGM